MNKNSNIVDDNSSTANMYGCEPCPKCRKRYRYRANDKPNLILCDDCGFTEMAIKINGEEVEGDE
jgi:ssDNA-binding Zn-finger/Zn-ribbon topoisomerase 1